MSKTIVSRILDDARKNANSTLEEGNAKARELLAETEREIAEYRQKNVAETFALRDDIVKRRISVANLEVKKVLLRAKKEILDRTFKEALDQILALPRPKYLELIEGMLSCAEDGDVVYVAERDARTITKKFVEELGKKRKIRLTRASVYVPISGGVVIASGNMEKNLSFDVELQALREEIEAEVAEKLFGER